jgi:inhibitor of cysteine peptidase
MKKLTEEFNKVSVVKGEHFAIELPSNLTTGYGWDVQLKAGKASLIMKDYVTDAKPGSMLVGGGGKEVFVYKAEETGVIDIEAQYKRDWENKPPAKVRNFSVTVK